MATPSTFRAHAAVALFLALVCRAPAAEQIDQSNLPEWAGGWTHVNPAGDGQAVMWQTFTPACTSLTAVEIDILTVNPGRGDDVLTIEIARDGVVLASAERAVEDGFDGLLRFEFPESVPLVPEQLYELMARDTGATRFGWKYGPNTYERGSRYVFAQQQLGYDWFFRTYAWVESAAAKYSGGTGEPNDPYQIATAADLIALGETPEDYDKHFILTADIDLDPNLPGRKVFDRAVIAPTLRTSTYPYVQRIPFSGVFDGNGHIISNLTISGGDDVGLFGSASAEITNLGLVNPHVTAEDGNNVSALVGEGGGYVLNCYVEGGRVSGKDGVGGLVGSARYSLVAHCRAQVSVSGRKRVGGVAGRATDTCIAYSCVVGSVTGDEDVGGIAGRVPKSANMAIVEDSYSLATVSGDVKTGGFAGSNYGRVVNCYSVGRVTGNEETGGFIGHDEGKTTACFWDVESSGCMTSAGGIGRTTAEMADASAFAGAGWDFQGETDGPSDIWAFPEGGGYPVLWWQVPESQLPPLPAFSGGTGQPDDPYIISTPADLNHIGHNPRLMAAHFILANDIDLAGVDFHIIGNEGIPFAGIFDGDSKEVLNLAHRSTARACIGFFGRVKGVEAMVKDLCLVDPNVDAGPGGLVASLVGDNWMATIMDCNVDGGRVRTYDWYVGGIAGYSDGSISGSRATCRVSGKGGVGGLVGGNDGSITASSSSGAVSGTYNGVGGLVGRNGGSITISSSSSSVRGSPMSSLIGGLVGHNGGSIASSHSGGSVSGTANDVGGLVGGNFGSIATSYSAGSVMGKETVGGLVGYNDWDASIATSYSSGLVSSSSSSSYVGGLVGYGYVEDVLACFWDIENSGQATSAGGTGKTTAEMQTAGTFLDAGWDFVGETANGTEDIWWILEGKDYPRLWWELYIDE